MDIPATRESGLWKRGVLWLLLLAPLFFASYSFANWLTAKRNDVGSLVFAWESQTPLWPWTIVPYWSIDLLYGLSFLLPATRREMDRHALRLLSVQIICVACFLLWPLRFTFERPELAGFFGWMFDVLMGFDKPFNQAPSLHIALLVVIWVMFARHTRGLLLRGLLHGWMALIGLSVLTTWQHHFIDVPTGVLAGWLCVWLWPIEGRSPLQHLQVARDSKRWRLALRYAFGSAVCAAVAANLGGAWLWLLWPCVALLLVALNYALIGAGSFQKQADGSLTTAAHWLFAPYLAGAWLNSRLWTQRHPQPDQVCPGIWLGRLPTTRQLQPFAAVLDLCAELPLRNDGKAYRNVALLDLITPSAADCLKAAEAIEQLRQHGPLLVCCALGYSRSACAVAAWLLHYGGSQNVEEALQRIRQARPQVVLSDTHQQALLAMRQLPEQRPSTQEMIHGL
ncbi:phosphatase PAP2/dual specificity phosphatase family protein [Aquipseudomonas ullengensis]|uniref:Phosphatase PAP2/dual specificity phosphatase family protein n=1 Tax=Aquipseudomonas ullengensis TaxID=2759166 RepID=A0A7W4Q942_9GAMM|nr:phosphatase PAP2/dual specificity phosphatase family protein [Pseudomonas ullengensis]MBB2494294.1 phosphatase PAP2/dual specificity phosphatase family protein [Pseudomonas ullengensis]